MQTSTRSLVDDYIDRLRAELADLPPARRDELVEEIEDHIDEALADTGGASEADLRTLLDRLGDPADIASEARDRLDYLPPPEPSRRRLEFVALVLLLPGSLFIPLFGWMIGIVLVWMSDVWDTRDKWVATLLPPGGLFTVFYFSFVVTVGGDGPTGAQQTAGIVLAVFLLVTPFVTTAYLAWRLRQLR